jgi:hypothetical protein
MREIELQQTRRRLSSVAQEIMVIGPDNRYEQVAHRVAEPCRPEQQKCLKDRVCDRRQVARAGGRRVERTHQGRSTPRFGRDRGSALAGPSQCPGRERVGPGL